MVDSVKVFDAESIDPSNSATSSEVPVRNDSSIAFQVDGDSNSDNLDVVREVKLRGVSGDAWTEWDTDSSEDVTSTNNNSKAFVNDVENAVKIRYVVTNNGGSTTTIDGVASTET